VWTDYVSDLLEQKMSLGFGNLSLTIGAQNYCIYKLICSATLTQMVCIDTIVYEKENTTPTHPIASIGVSNEEMQRENT
jgi:hypothetical protein